MIRSYRFRVYLGGVRLAASKFRARGREASVEASAEPSPSRFDAPLHLVVTALDHRGEPGWSTSTTAGVVGRQDLPADGVAPARYRWELRLAQPLAEQVDLDATSVEVSLPATAS